MRTKNEKLVACPISKSSNHDEYNDICKATGKTCPFFEDEGMSVCKSKAKCLAYFAKNWSNVNHEQVAKLIAADTKSSSGRRNKYTNTIKGNIRVQDVEHDEVQEENVSFLDDLADALKNHEETEAEKSSLLDGLENALKNHEETEVEKSSLLDGLEDALKNHIETSDEEEKPEDVEKKVVSAIEMYKRKN